MRVSFAGAAQRTFWGGFALLFAASAFGAGAVITSVKGEARSIIGPNAHGPLVQNQRLEPGMTITTGQNAQVVMKFDDGQVAVVNPNAEFKVVEFRYNKDKPLEDSAVFNLARGALRMITGALGHRSPMTFALRTPTATMGIRGTDFMVAIVDQTYVSVSEGVVTATNAGGTATFGAGSVGSVGAGTLGTTIPASSLPAAASGSFSTMSSVTISAAGGAAGGAAAGAAGATTAGGAGLGLAVGVGAAAAAAAAAASNGSNTTTTHH